LMTLSRLCLLMALTPEMDDRHSWDPY